jgi:excisionase family DNA binding protein
MERLLLKPGEAAESLGIGRSKVYELIASGTVPSLKIGGSVRVPAQALRRWVEGQLKQNRRPSTQSSRSDQDAVTTAGSMP